MSEGKTPQMGNETVAPELEEQLNIHEADDPERANFSQECVKVDEKTPSDQGPVESDALPVAGRSVAFPPAEIDHDIEEKPIGNLNRPRGVEMRRELTTEERVLAQAGYDHLEEPKVASPSKGEDELDKVDIQEHRLKFKDLENALETSMVTKDPSQSRGLEIKVAAERLVRDGKNVLTPPKKKSAFRKVSVPIYKVIMLSRTFLSTWIA